MSNKNNSKTNKGEQQHKSILNDRRDVELTFLKNMNKKFNHKPNQGDQVHVGKRNRNLSDDDDDEIINLYGTPKRLKSNRRNPRTITNSYYSSTSATNHNHNSPVIDDNRTLSDNNNPINNKTTNENNQIRITNNAIKYAIDQPLPSLKFECQPKIKDQNEGSIIIKELIKSIDNEMNQINTKLINVVGFESWFIDNNGGLICITRDINLFVFLCDAEHVPNKLAGIEIKVVLPKHLPPQRSILIKGVPNSLKIGDIKNSLMNKFKSIYNVEDINGTINGKTHYVRTDILNENEYNKIFNAGIICLEGLCLHVYEYLAAPRVLFCSKCNEPGHSKKFCTLKFDRCRRCGKDRNNGEHSNCVIICHNCQGDHTASDYKCPTVQRYRCDLIQHIQRHPEVLPEHVQLFIPSQFRKQGDRTFNNRLYSHYQQNNTNVKWYNNINANNNDWPPLTPPIQSSIYSNRIREVPYNETIKSLQVQLQELDVKCTVAKDEYDRSNMEIKNKIN